MHTKEHKKYNPIPISIDINDTWAFVMYNHRRFLALCQAGTANNKVHICSFNQCGTVHMLYGSLHVNMFDLFLLPCLRVTTYSLEASANVPLSLPSVLLYISLAR